MRMCSVASSYRHFSASKWFQCRYDVMKRCWQEEPEHRPTFSEMVTVISTSLEGMSGYLDLTTQPLAPAPSQDNTSTCEHK